MATVLSLTENSYRLKNARNFLNQFSNAQYSLYAFTGYATSFSNVEGEILPEVQQPTQDVHTSYAQVWRNMLFGKKVGDNNCQLIVNYNPWVTDTVYAQYDDTDSKLFTKEFYVHVNEVSYTHCYKCLYNNQGNVSTQQPSISFVNASDDTFTTSDNYIWKYMYSVDKTTVTSFGNQSSIPFIANTNVSNNAVAGAIDIITVDTAGLGYSNYTNGIFSVSQTRLNGNTLVYSVDGATNPSSSNSFYNGCILLITSGVGAGQYANIISYQVNTSTHYVVLEHDFNTVPQNGSEYIISPGVTIMGDGTETELAQGYASIDPTLGNSVQSIIMLDVGRDYKIANTVIRYSNTVPVTKQAVIRAINGPRGGHGFDAADELGCNTVCVSVSFANSEQNTIPYTGSYRQLGLLENPTFTGCSVGVQNLNGIFITGETVATYTDLKISDQAVTQISNSIVSAVDGDFLNQLTQGDYVHLYNDVTDQIAIVKTITNSTSFQLTTNAYFSASEVNISIPKFLGQSTCTGATGNQLLLSDITGNVASGLNVIGFSSGSTAQIANVSISNINKSFNTFVQMQQYDGYNVIGNFQQGEEVYQTNANQYGYYDSSNKIDDTQNRYYVSNQLGVFSYGANLVGANSGAVAHLNAVYQPELVYGVGNIIYIQNFIQIERDFNRQEIFKIFLNF